MRAATPTPTPTPIAVAFVLESEAATEVVLDVGTVEPVAVLLRMLEIVKDVEEDVEVEVVGAAGLYT